MLTIRRSQMRRMLEALRGPFLERLDRIVDEASPRGLQGIDGAARRPLLVALVDEAHRRGLDAERVVARWVCLALEYGPSFDSSPALAVAYDGPVHEADERFTQAVANAPELVWAPRAVADLRAQFDTLMKRED